MTATTTTFGNTIIKILFLSPDIASFPTSSTPGFALTNSAQQFKGTSYAARFASLTIHTTAKTLTWFTYRRRRRQHLPVLVFHKYNTKSSSTRTSTSIVIVIDNNNNNINFSPRPSNAGCSNSSADCDFNKSRTSCCGICFVSAVSIRNAVFFPSTSSKMKVHDDNNNNKNVTFDIYLFQLQIE